MYDAYAYQRIIQKVDELVATHPHLSFSAIATAISNWKNATFHREYLTRLRKQELTDPHVNTIVDWIVEHHDPKFRSKLSPDAIFAEVGESSRDFYFHFSQMDRYETWEEEILKAFSGVYLCAPAHDRNTYMPMPALRQFFPLRSRADPAQTSKRALDIKQYIAERTILVLRHTPTGYYHAAEYPISLLFPPDFITLDIKMVYEGIGIASGNSIRVFLRECLSRVGKAHSILIHPKGQNEAANPHGLSINIDGDVRKEVRADWSVMNADNLDHMRKEFAEAIELDYFLAGTAQIEVSPVPNVQNRISMTFSRDYVYHRKPVDFLRDPALHFIRPELDNSTEIERIIANPLSVGGLR